MGKTRFILGGSLIDGSGADVRRNVFLAVKDSIITAIGPAAELPREGAAIEDFSHCTIVPALVDCSVSLIRSPSVDSRVRVPAEEAGSTEKSTLLEQHIRYCHIHGVLGVADSDNIIDLVKRYREKTKQQKIFIRAPVPPCTPRKGGTSSNPAAGAFLRINYSGNIDDGDAPDPILTHKELHRILQYKNGKKVVVANGLQQVSDALESGCDAIEQGYAMGEDNLREMAKNNVLWIPSVLRAKNGLDSSTSGGDVCCRFSTRYVAPGKPVPGAEAFWKKMLSEQLLQLRLARKIGVTTAVGTGAGGIGILHGESMVEEMKMFIRAGYSLAETFRCASENGARFFGMENLGTLTVGRKATFLITRGTAQQLPRKLSYLEGIYIDGVPSTTYRKNPVRTA